MFLRFAFFAAVCWGQCFDGSSHSRIELGAHGLKEFELAFRFKAKECLAGPSSSHHFHSSGCSLVSAVRGFMKDRDDWFVERREGPALAPRESLEQPRSMSIEDQARRAFVEEALSKGSRSDWGVSMSPKGHILFGIGHRDFGESTEFGGLKRSGARPVRDLTATTEATFLDDEWHEVVVKREKSSSQKHSYDPHDTSKLSIFVDGIAQKTKLAATGGKSSTAAAAIAARDSGGSRGFGGSAPLHPLVDATYHVTVGERLVGCVEDVRLTSRHGEAEEKKKIPLYYYVHGDEESLSMRDAFVGSMVDPEEFETREMRAGDVATRQSERFGTKITLILKAIRENPPGTLLVVTDIDLRFFKPVARIVREYATDDIAFQRDEDRSLQVNLGFMAIRCSQAVYDLFAITGEIIQKKRRGTTGDQRIINRALAQPYFYGTPRIRWTVFPPELMTNSIANSLRTDNMYGANVEDYVLFHANDYGRATLGPDKARFAKLKLLTEVTLMIARDPHAPPTSKRWPSRNTKKRPGGKDLC